MAFVETTILSTREPCFGSRQLAQAMAVPTGRIDKVSLYLEPHVQNQDEAANIDVIVRLMAVDVSHLPVGIPLAEDSVKLSDLDSRGFVNFRLEATTDSVVAVVVMTTGATSDNYVAWRYVQTMSSGEELLISSDDGATWSQDPTRKFTFVAYSTVDNAVDEDDQSVTVTGGISKSVVDDSESEFTLATLTRAVVDGDTVVIDFGDQVITIVVDQSGSMTWNDREGLRFDFLEQYIDDLELNLPAGKEATYSLVKFNSRKIGDLDIYLQTEESGSFIEGVRIVRKIGSAPTTPSDGLVVFEGLASSYTDENLTQGTIYHYAAYTFDTNSNFSSARRDSLIPQAPSTPPLGVAYLLAEERVVLSSGNDIGLREVDVSWVNPAGFDYDKVTVVRRTDRYPQSEDDGVSLVFDPRVTTSFVDFDASSLDPDDHPINGITYYYSIFSEDTATSLKTYKSNARRSQVKISTVDRTWELLEPPLNVPPAGFDDTPPANPTSVVVTIGNQELLITWSAGDANGRRYRIFYDGFDYPRKQTSSNGSSDYSGVIVYDGISTSFVHRSLSNSQPHFYVIVAMDTVSNQSSGVQFIGTPSSSTDDVIPPQDVSDFSAEVVNLSTALLSWKLELSRQRSVEAYFGDTVRLTTTLTFSDANPRRTTADLEFVEESRTLSVYNENGNSVQDDTTNQAVDPFVALVFDTAPTSVSNVLYADVSVTPFLSIQNLINNIVLKTHSSLNIKDARTSEVITEVISNTATVTFRNPFELFVSNDPPQEVQRRRWDPACNEGSQPAYKYESVPGVFTRSGEQFLALIEARYRNESLNDDINLQIRILDKETGLVSSRIKLPETSTDGTAILTTSKELEEILDRTGQPIGESEERDVIRISLPPQDDPGEYIIEVTGEYEGYTRTARLEMTFEPSLNIDVKPKAFLPNGVDVAEQQAFVYIGSFSAEESTKIPVTDLTVTNWEITKISGGGPDKRPLFSRDNVPGTGVKAYSRSGVARMVYFGPGTDIEPPSTATCTEGEIFQLKVTASVMNMSAEGYATIELLPFKPCDDRRLFLRLVKDQVDEKGESFETSNLAKMTIYADGEHESAWEIIARPDEDTETGLRSAADFKTKLVNNNGLVPDLKDGTVVSIFVNAISSTGSPTDVVIRTDLNHTGKKATAKATIIDGKASFYLSSNMLVQGKILDTPLEGELGNQYYSSGDVVWESSAVVFAVTAQVVLEVNGQPVVFSGGGGSTEEDALPAFLSLTEPLSETDPTGN